MKPQVQSRIGQDGRCFPACLASILELPEAEVPDLDNTDEDEVNAFLKPHGLRYREVPIEADTPIPVGYHIICGVSPRGGMHAVVGRDGEFIHDPHPVSDDPRRGVVKPERWGVLTPTKSLAQDRELYTWGDKDVPNLRAIIGNLKATVAMIEAEQPITRERRAEVEGYRREIAEWERLLAKCGVAERRGVKDAKVRTGMIGVWSYGYPHWRWKLENEYLPENVDAALAYWRRDHPDTAFRTAVKTPVGRPSPAESLKPLPRAKDRADMMQLRRNTQAQGGPFQVQLTDPNGREHTESVHALRAYDVDLQPVPPYKVGDNLHLANGKRAVVHKIALSENLLGEPEWHILTTSGDYVTVKIK